jgi:hypothetical protein
MGKKKLEPPTPPYTIQEYEKSPWWKKKSSDILSDKNYECEICHRKRWKWLPRAKKWKRMYRGAVHHKSYANIPYEKPEDLARLCFQCHDLSHLILRLENMGEFYKLLAKIVRKYFVYDATTHKKKEL